MNNDPYVTLGLQKSATAEDIKKSYRKLVRTSHPDLHPGDAGAEARFKAVSAAYDLLKDPQTRARFDAGEIDASGAERQDRRFYRDYADAPGNTYQRSRGSDDQSDPSDIFAEMLRQHARGQGAGGASAQGAGGTRGAGGDPFGPRGFSAPGADLRYALDLPFLDAARGTRTRITLPDGGILEIQIPQGASEGQTLRLRAKGAPGFGGGPPGDALVTLSVRPHPVFRRDGDDIVVTLPITLDEAVLGARVEVPTIEGTVTLTIPKEASSGRILRLRGRGVTRPGAAAGDQRVELRIVLPPLIDEALQSFMLDWRKSKSYDPRKGLFEGMPK